jgi:hypothetical protein
MSIPEVARRVAIGRLAVCSMLEQGLLPNFYPASRIDATGG